MNKLQSDKNSTVQVRIDAGLHKLLKIKAAKSGTTIRTIIEGCLDERLSPLYSEKMEKQNE